MRLIIAYPGTFAMNVMTLLKVKELLLNSHFNIQKLTGIKDKHLLRNDKRCFRPVTTSDTASMAQAAGAITGRGFDW